VRVRRASLILFVACLGCAKPADSPPAAKAQVIPEPYVIQVTGRDHAWYFRYPGSGESGLFQPGGQTLQEIHVPTDTDLVFILDSADYAYTMTIRQQGIREMALPDCGFPVKFHPTESGSFALTGEEFCGPQQPALQGSLVVESPADFGNWLESARRLPAGR
jgi:cytochrome c oxidase subunit 2